MQARFDKGYSLDGQEGWRMKWIDLRSDTVTEPTPEMREAMARADVGDDVYAEDPTVNRLQEMAAERMGMEAALFVPSGTMGNLGAVLAHCDWGDEVIVGDRSHTYINEAGGISVLGGVHTFAVRNLPDGTMSLEEIESAIRPDNPHFPISKLICLENTHNRCGGAFLTPEYTRQVVELAGQHGLKLHIDGARIFNAAVAQGIEAARLVDGADSVTFCLSKGLCAPVGSLICGSKDFIHRALRIRKLLGGGMRQAGVVAAAGIVALETMVDRLAEDHHRARKLADFLAGLPAVELETARPPTNMVYFRLRHGGISAEEFLAATLQQGIRISPPRAGTYRLVLHYWIDDEALNRVENAFKEIFGHA